MAALVAWACLGLWLPHSTPAWAAGISVSVEPRQFSTEEAHSLGFLRIQPSKTAAYVGELVPVAIKAYFREALQARLNGSPRLEGTAFTWHLADGEPQRTREVVGRQVYTVLTWYAGMSATKPGDHPMTAQLQATLLVSEPTPARGHATPGGSPLDSLFGDDFFADFFGRVQERSVTLASEARSLRAEPLPADGQPVDFKGAVGHFELSASATPVNVAPGDPVTLRMTLRGHGNFDRAAPPRLSDESSFRTYAPVSEFDPLDTVGCEGVKRFEQVIIPKDPAVAEIPAVVFTYFDPDAAQYKTARTAPIPLRVASGEGTAAPAVPWPHTAAQELIGQADSTSSGGPESGSALRHELGRLSRDMKPALLRPWFMGLQAVPLLAIGWGLHWHRRSVRRRDEATLLRRKRAARAVAGAMASVEAALCACDSAAFFAACRRAVQERLGERWRLPPAAITLAEIRKRLPEALELQRAFETADAVAYSGQTCTQDQLQSLLRTVRRELASLGGGA